MDPAQAYEQGRALGRAEALREVQVHAVAAPTNVPSRKVKTPTSYSGTGKKDDPTINI